MISNFGLFSLRGVQIAIQICCVLGHKELFDFFLNELPIPIGCLTEYIYALLLKSKGIRIPLMADCHLVCFDAIELVMVLNQHQFLECLLPQISMKPAYQSRYTYHAGLWIRKNTAKTAIKRGYRIEPELYQISRWLELAVCFGAS